MSVTELGDALLHRFPLQLLGHLRNPFLKKGTEMKPDYEFNHELPDELYARVRLPAGARATAEVPAQALEEGARTFHREFRAKLAALLGAVEALPEEHFARADVPLEALAAEDAALSAQLEAELARHRALRERLLAVQAGLFRADLCPPSDHHP